MRALVVMMVLCASCEPAADDTADPCVHDPPLDYENFGAPFLEQFCNGCHSSIVPPDHRNGAPAAVNFDSYVAVMTWSDRIHTRVLLVEDPGDAMPPGGGPTDEERTKLAEWVQCAVKPDYERYLEQETP